MKNENKTIIAENEDILLTVESTKSKTQLIWGIILLPILIGLILLCLYFSKKRNQLNISKRRVFGRLVLDGSNKEVGNVYTSIPINKVTFVSKSYTKKKKNEGYVYIGSPSAYISFGLTNKCDEIYDLLVNLTCINYVEVKDDEIDNDISLQNLNSDNNTNETKDTSNPENNTQNDSNKDDSNLKRTTFGI